ncbi:hypothetical protein JX265_002645 [Neoarthrinium moseri]|uniref:Uncharacterized protein n=1 Tax=Neoarthrinium moseri TaxID=1658444 RepID=A0A9P9WUW1_9PEZI|nr:hypothetical protein JX265_002645 [Neoarthrinium moseri]
MQTYSLAHSATISLPDRHVFWAVCGEVIYRGAECVSLGWCFWHRACYGCLFCGSRRIAKGAHVEDVYRDNDGGNDAPHTTPGAYTGDAVRGLDNAKAKEILDIPLCANCVVETEADDNGTVVQKALRRIDKADGGLSRDRWGKKDRATHHYGHSGVHRTTGKISRISGGSPSERLSHPWRITADGVGDDSTDDTSGYCMVPLDSTIYVSIHDPVGRPAFKPSPTKPIPQWIQPPWMKQLPSQHQPSRAVDPRPTSILDDHFQDVTSASAILGSASVHSTACPTTTFHTLRHGVSPNSRMERAETFVHSSRSPTPTENDTVHNIPRGASISFVTAEPLKRPSSRAVNQSQISRINSPEPSRGPGSPPHISSGYQDQGIDDVSQRNSSRHHRHRPPSPIMSALSHIKGKIRRTPPSQSNEYLELYQPAQSTSGKTKTATASIAVAGRGRVRRIGNWRQTREAEADTTKTNQSSVDLVQRLDRRHGGHLESSHVEGRSSPQTGYLKRSTAQTDLWKLFGRSAGDSQK